MEERKTGVENVMPSSRQHTDYCCERFARAIQEDLIRPSDRYGNYHLMPTEQGCSNPSISYCPFCGVTCKPELREMQMRHQRIIDEYYKQNPSLIF
jgi:hypothetical protein